MKDIRFDQVNIGERFEYCNTGVKYTKIRKLVSKYSSDQYVTSMREDDTKIIYYCHLDDDIVQVDRCE